uniref:Uncharacterized protein n=1 Tax=Panagrolaimus sp. JU765 TaxID=591449 RepID=A0AC34R3C4_9BILA
MSFLSGYSIENKAKYLLSLKPSPCPSIHPVKVGKKRSRKPPQNPYHIDSWRERKISLSSSNCSDSPQTSTQGTNFEVTEPVIVHKNPTNSFRKLVDSVSAQLEKEELDNRCKNLSTDFEYLLYNSHLIMALNNGTESEFPADLVSVDVSSFKELLAQTNFQPQPLQTQRA